MMVMTEKQKAAINAESYSELLRILNTMSHDEIMGVDDGSLPTWGDRPAQAEFALSWDTTGEQTRWCDYESEGQYPDHESETGWSQGMLRCRMLNQDGQREADIDW